MLLHCRFHGIDLPLQGEEICFRGLLHRSTTGCLQGGRINPWHTRF